MISQPGCITRKNTFPKYSDQPQAGANISPICCNAGSIQKKNVHCFHVSEIRKQNLKVATYAAAMWGSKNTANIETIKCWHWKPTFPSPKIQENSCICSMYVYIYIYIHIIIYIYAYSTYNLVLLLPIQISILSV